MLLAEGKPGPEGSDGGGGSCTMFMDRMGGGGGRAFSEEDEGGRERKTCYLCSDYGGGKRRNVAEVLLPTKKSLGKRLYVSKVQRGKQGQDFPLSGAKLRGKKSAAFVRSSSARKRSVQT